MEIFLIIALFATTALSLNFIVAQKTKLAGTCLIANLCLTVALAYQLALINSILLIAIVVGAVALGGLFLIKYKRG